MLGGLQLLAALAAWGLAGARFELGVGARAEQAQHGVGGALAERQLLHVAFAVEARPLVEGLDQDREGDRCVQVALGDREAQAFGDQAEADHQQKAQAQHHHRGVAVDEVRQRLARQQHDRHRDGDGGVHHAEVFDHADRGDHRVEREHHIEHHDLGQHHAERG